MKKLIRLLIKIPATPLVVVFCLFGYISFSFLAFIQWVYEASKFSKEVTDDCRNDMTGILKKWFTTI